MSVNWRNAGPDEQAEMQLGTRVRKAGNSKFNSRVDSAEASSVVSTQRRTCQFWALNGASKWGICQKESAIECINSWRSVIILKLAKGTKENSSIIWLRALKIPVHISKKNLEEAIRKLSIESAKKEFENLANTKAIMQNKWRRFNNSKNRYDAIVIRIGWKCEATQPEWKRTIGSLESHGASFAEAIGIAWLMPMAASWMLNHHNCRKKCLAFSKNTNIERKDWTLKMTGGGWRHWRHALLKWKIDTRPKLAVASENGQQQQLVEAEQIRWKQSRIGWSRAIPWKHSRIGWSRADPVEAEQNWLKQSNPVEA